MIIPSYVQYIFKEAWIYSLAIYMVTAIIISLNMNNTCSVETTSLPLKQNRQWADNKKKKMGIFIWLSI